TLTVLASMLATMVASVLAALVVTPAPSASADTVPPRRIVTGWLPYWTATSSTDVLVANRDLFTDSSPFWFTAKSATSVTAQLSQALHAHGKKLTVAVPVMYDATRTSSSGYWVYDYAGIGPYVDRMRIMTYDYSVSRAGPIAPIAWVSRVAAFAATQLTASK